MTAPKAAPDCPHPDQAVQVDPRDSAREAGLRYVSDLILGIRRRRAGKGFTYLEPGGAPLRDTARIREIRALAIPPAWTDVWICPAGNGHIQATGRDARGRKQYVYHDRWKEVRDATKYDRCLAFGEALSRIRGRIDADLRRPGLPRDRVLAMVVRLLDEGQIRVGNAEYARDNDSFGLTTLHEEHVDVIGQSIRFRFRGKSGREHDVSIRDRRLARAIQQIQDLPGEELFTYLDEDGAPHPVDSDDVNAYIREAAGADFSAKDFRTWVGTVYAASRLREAGPPETEREAARLLRAAIKETAAHLGNTTAVCRKCYVHPIVVESFVDHTLFQPHETQRPRPAGAAGGLAEEEAAVLTLLRQQEERARQRRRRGAA